ncbi:hypothetical protein EYB53_007480 [Candidatus Chloroploca sp. M-50]|uniref:Uncharacterized protein n=1 Tax=Candidatus Chloroploca mongolica TaxID=2528176 RepID=A0ABS4D7X4_9CHLR|nr:hypothetical protein [Candidatus Chloroploca mongolica]MBP1465544.1 hypothetical protein [Candidatus Chloroploca mongolica]
MNDQHSIGGKASKVWNNTYTRSQNLFDRLVPPPTVQKRVNPYLVASLELLGLMGFLGIGRMVAGDVQGGIRAMITWWFIFFVNIVSLIILVVVNIFLIIPTFGMSFILSMFFGLPFAIVFWLTPIRSAIKLFQDLS